MPLIGMMQWMGKSVTRKKFPVMRMSWMRTEVGDEDGICWRHLAAYWTVYADATSQMHHWEAKTTTPQRNKRMYWLHKLIDFMLPSDSELIITRTTISNFVYSTLSLHRILQNLHKNPLSGRLDLRILGYNIWAPVRRGDDGSSSSIIDAAATSSQDAVASPSCEERLSAANEAQWIKKEQKSQLLEANSLTSCAV